MNRPTIFNLRRWLFGLALGVSFTLVPAYGQSCALCYTQAASSGNRMIHALQNGIIILVVPPMFLSVGFTLLAYRKRNQYRDAHYPPKPKLATRKTTGTRVSNMKVAPRPH
jgi:hypothetical protein